MWLELSDYREVIEAIKELRIRGAPAIGVAGAFAVALAAAEIEREGGGVSVSQLESAAREIEQARPTGANLRWAVRRMLGAARRAEAGDSGESMVAELAREAEEIHEEDERANLRMGRFGADLMPKDGAVLTHCNAGALATGGYGTALGVIRAAWDAGRISGVFATETRPVLQGARLTAWELVRDGIDATLIPDSAAGQLMRSGRVQAVIVGADRIAANGDVANKIGTYNLAVLASEHRLPLYVAAPTSTVDLEAPTGDSIPIEERAAQEVTHLAGKRVAAEGIKALNFAFDVTPHKYVAAIITEAGIVREPYEEGLRQVVETGSV